MTVAEPNRVFFALWPNDPVRKKIEATARTLRTRHALGGSLSKAERYHLTLFFIGDHVMKETESAAARAARPINAPPFTLCLDQAGSFGNAQSPIWLGPSEPPRELAYLERMLHAQLAGLPRKPQPRFSPHLTILRRAAKTLHKEPIEPIRWRVEEFVLIRSTTSQDSIRYRELARYSLHGKPLPPEPEQATLF